MAVSLLTACKDKIIHEHMANVPIYEDYETFRSSIDFEQPRDIDNQLGIYVYNDYLFVVEENEGVHFINNVNPASPQKIGFLNVRGCSGLAIKNEMLYVNNLIDVAVVDVSNINQPAVVSRLENVFPQNYPTGDANYSYKKPDEEQGVVVGWEVQEVKEEVSAANNYYSFENADVINFNGSIATGTGGGTSTTSVSGSITKFALIDDYLYIMNNFDLIPINISDPLNLTTSASTQVWMNVETLFPSGDKLYMGTTTGMMIYSTTTPTTPEHLGTMFHQTACDPVVVQGDYAYVTIRSGTTCMGDINQLDVVDISNPSSPTVQASFLLTNPHGLGVKGDVLYICDGSDGLKVFDNTNPLTVGNNMISNFTSIQAIDIIPIGDIAIVLTTDGVYQYDCSDVQNIQYLSKIQ